MIIAIANLKGGVGKTTTAVHLAACLHTVAPTLLLDGDDTRSATSWSLRGKKAGKGFPFRIADEKQAAMLARNFEHTVIDTGQAPSVDDLKALMEGCDLLVVPAVPAGLDSDGLALTINTLQSIGASAYKVLLTKTPPPPEPEGAELRAALLADEIPMFSVDIPRFKVFDKAAVAGTTVNDTAFFSSKDAPRAARAWAAYQAVANEVMSYVHK